MNTATKSIIVHFVNKLQFFFLYLFQSA